MNTQIVIQTTATGRRILNIQTYKSQDELKHTHPEVKAWIYIYHIPRGMSTEAMRAGLIQSMERHGQWYTIVYHIGDFIMAPAVDQPELCICLERRGDNGPCPVHGDPYGHLEGRN